MISSVTHKICQTRSLLLNTFFYNFSFFQDFQDFFIPEIKYTWHEIKNRRELSNVMYSFTVFCLKHFVKKWCLLKISRFLSAATSNLNQTEKLKLDLLKVKRVTMFLLVWNFVLRLYIVENLFLFLETSLWINSPSCASIMLYDCDEKWLLFLGLSLSQKLLSEHCI